ncbi:MAG TPA: PQQ-binding-like beta-propeller repeat protein [Vicinamibacterales bacterium]|nr:PQQ-binding-like beta-propeller repeat protein [Vicinamibacterales bacterium]
MLLCLIRFVAPLIFPEVGAIAIIGGVLGALAIVVWWLFFSRAVWPERLGALAVMIVAPILVLRVVHESIATGMMGMTLPLYSVPVMSVALVAWAVTTRHLSNGFRRSSLIASILLACGAFALLRTGGVLGAGSEIHWRWTPTPEERLLAQANDEPAPLPPAPVTTEATKEPVAPSAASEVPLPAPAHDAEKPPETSATHAATTAIANDAEWPGFRGPDRDSSVHGVRIDTDWSRTPPVQLWRRPIGPGWSSFAVRGDLIYTQEQRGDDEIVSAYKMSTGEPVWRHRERVRFWESNGGAGPRGTPTLDNGRVYSFGATGILNALEASSGKLLWSRNVAAETKTEVPGWGFASSPLVIGDVVIVAADATLVGYAAATGRPRWVGPVLHGSYSSPHPTTIDGIRQVMLLGGSGVTSLAPANGTVLWEHPWQGVAIVQPALTPDGVVINTVGGTGGNGTRRLTVAHSPSGWSVEERWTSNGLKPYYNDFVVHNGYAFGFDGSILACIDMETGKRVWKGGRYGNGQLLLLPDQDLLLVLSEDGNLALVSATPGEFKEIARVPAIEGKTWNHPVLVGNVLLVRNGEEMAAFRLSLAGD